MLLQPPPPRNNLVQRFAQGVRQHVQPPLDPGQQQVDPEGGLLAKRGAFVDQRLGLVVPFDQRRKLESERAQP